MDMGKSFCRQRIGIITLWFLLTYVSLSVGSLFDDVSNRGANTKRELTNGNFGPAPSLADQLLDASKEGEVDYLDYDEGGLIPPIEDPRQKNQIIINVLRGEEGPRSEQHKLKEYSMKSSQQREVDDFVRQSYGAADEPPINAVPTTYTQFQGPIAVHFNTYNDERVESSLLDPVYDDYTEPIVDQRQPREYNRNPRDGHNNQANGLNNPASLFTAGRNRQSDPAGPPAPPPPGALITGNPVRPPAPPVPVRPPSPIPRPTPIRPPPPPRPNLPAPRPPSPPSGGVYTHLNLNINNDVPTYLTYGNGEEAEVEEVQQDAIYEYDDEVLPSYDGGSQNDPALPLYQGTNAQQAPQSQASPPQEAPPTQTYSVPFQADFSDAQPSANPANGYAAPIAANPTAGYQAPNQFDPTPSYQAPAQSNPSSSYGAPVQSDPLPTYQPTQSDPVPSYQAPAQLNPVNSYGAPIQSDPLPSYQPPQSNPVPAYQSPPQSNPAPTYQAPPQSNPVNSYGAPVQSDPVPTYQSPQSNPTSGYQAPVQFNPTPIYTPPAQADPTPIYQAPAQANPISGGYQAPAQSNPSSGYEAPLPAADPAPSYQAPPQFNPAPSYQAPALANPPSFQPAVPVTLGFATFNVPQANPRPSYNQPRNDPLPQYGAPSAQSAPSNSPTNLVLASPLFVTPAQANPPRYGFSNDVPLSDANAVHYHVHVADAQGLDDLQDAFSGHSYVDVQNEPPRLQNPVQNRPRKPSYRGKRKRSRPARNPRRRNPRLSGMSEILKMKCLLWCGFSQFEFQT
eukprot:snap_masked-scaffold1213_size55396-processed-gene-0.2 protein:Tk09823 transcript:snap_masked-scaffold1213_size55396-processed-gene-0.2-mRNA-1 annotation:"PREDICTED: mucin-1-like"